MPKLFGVRIWIGFAAVLVAAAAAFVMHDGLSAWRGRSEAWISARNSGNWRQHELAFLKEAYDRLESERRAFAGAAPASLLNEQQEILRRMAQTAAPIRDQVPPDIRALLTDEAAASAKPEKPAPQVAAGAQTAAAPPPAAAIVPQPVALRTGAADFPGIDLDLSALAPDPGLDEVMDRVQKIRKPHQAKAAATPAASDDTAATGSNKQ